MYIGIIFAITSASFYAINSLFYKKLSEKLNEYEALTFSSFFLIFFAGLGNLLWGQFKINLNIEIFLFITIGSLIGFIGLLYLFKSFEHLPIGIIMTLSSIFPIITLILTTIYNKISISIYYLIPFAIIIFGIYLIHQTSLKTSKKYIYMPLITAIGWGVYSFTSYTLIQNSIPAITITFYLETSIFLYALIYSILKNKLIITKIKLKQNIYYGIGAGFFLTLGMFLITKSITTLHPAIASSIGTSEIVFVSIFSYFIFKEKISINQLKGMITIILGIIIYLFL